MSSLGLVLLAAGGSTRLGSPKQLLMYQGRSLLRRAAETALASVCRPVVIVLGAQAARMEEELDGLAVTTVENVDWQQGMGGSLCIGLECLMAQEEALEGVVICLCDQPLLSSDIINGLVEAHRRTGSPIVASEYGDTLGVPALFARPLFPELLALRPSEGAKRLLQRRPAQTVAVPFPGGNLDIDTPADYDRLENNA